MYFGIGPKERKSDLYGFGGVFAKLAEALKSENRLIVVKGLRRTGKTSLITTAYNELPHRKMFVDAREIEGYGSKAVYSHFMEKASGYMKGKSVFRRMLETVSSVELGVKLGIRQQKPLLSALLKEIDAQAGRERGHFYIFIDEAQLLKASGFANFIAYAYDKLPHVKTVIAGSEVGLLDEFAGESSSSALYGRARVTIATRKFLPDESLEFLRKGFAQAGKKHSEENIAEAVASLDGSAGWLNMYGFYALSESHSAALEKVRKEGGKIVKDEISAFLAPRNVAEGAYLGILVALCVEPLPWGRLKSYLTVKLGRDVPDSRLFAYINALEDYGFIEKINGAYSITDPLIKEAIKGYKK